MTLPLDHYLRLWNLRDPEPLARTPRSDVYAVYQNGQKLALKLLTAEGAEDETPGAVALRYYDGCGAVRLLAYDEGAHLLEYIEGEELAQMVYHGDDLGAAAIIADILNQLHRPQPEVTAPPMRDLRRRFRDLFLKAARDEAAGEQSIYVRGARMAEHLLATERDQCVLHGDMHHHNVRLHPVRGWLAYDPKGLYGERSYDAANTLCNPCNASELVRSEDRLLRVTQVLADGMGVGVGRLRAYVFAYACLSAVWWGEEDDSDVMQQVLSVARNAERHADPAG